MLETVAPIKAPNNPHRQIGIPILNLTFLFFIRINIAAIAVGTKNITLIPCAICCSILENIDSNNINKMESNESTNTQSIININTATIDELDSLPGIGNSKAQNIIDYRNINGNFKTIEDIMNVNGIGTAIYEQIKAYITI